MTQKDSGKVNIHGKEYETVASRVQRFRQEHGDKYAIVTDIQSRTDDVVVMKATIVRIGGAAKDGDGQYTEQIVVATGYAEERRDSSSINKTSALENAETSAIGRALANFGMAGTEYASADEVANAISARTSAQSDAPKPAVGTATTDDKPISNAQGAMLLGMAKRASGLTERADVMEFFEMETGNSITDVKQTDVARIKAVFGDVEVES